MSVSGKNCSEAAYQLPHACNHQLECTKRLIGVAEKRKIGKESEVKVFIRIPTHGKKANGWINPCIFP